MKNKGTIVLTLSLAFATLAFGIDGQAQKDAGTDPAPKTDRVGFPKDYQKYTVLRTVDIPKKNQIGIVYGNELAASVANASQLPYPYGSIIVMEWKNAVKDASGNPVLDANGRFQPGEVEHIDVMRREKGFGEGYGKNRSGEWEYAGYRLDGSYTTPPERSATCAACHVNAGAARDFVYKGRISAESGG